MQTIKAIKRPHTGEYFIEQTICFTVGSFEEVQREVDRAGLKIISKVEDDAEGVILLWAEK